MASRWQPNPRADQAERDVEDYLRALGNYVLSVEDYAKGGAPILRGAGNALVQPDQIAMGQGEARAFDCKWKERAVPRHTYPKDGARCAGSWLHGPPGRCSLGRACGGRLYTGFDYNSYNGYRGFESASGIAAAIVFLHEAEDEVRCATLWDLDRIERAPEGTQAQYAGSKGGMRNYWYEEIPLWVRYSELQQFVADFRKSGRARWPSCGPIVLSDGRTAAPVPAPKQQSLHAIMKHAERQPPTQGAFSGFDLPSSGGSLHGERRR